MPGIEVKFAMSEFVNLAGEEIRHPLWESSWPPGGQQDPQAGILELPGKS